jgi:hypothetical protein
VALIAGTALSATSLAVIYAVLVEDTPVIALPKIAQGGMRRPAGRRLRRQRHSSARPLGMPAVGVAAISRSLRRGSAARARYS